MGVLPLVPVALTTALLWGMAPIFNKVLMTAYDVPPAAIIIVGGVACAVSVMCFALYHNVDAVRQVRALTARSVCIIAVSAVLTAFLANLLFVYVLRDHASYIVTALVYLAPVFTLLLALVVLHERATVLGVVGSGLMLVGVLMVALSHQ